MHLGFTKFSAGEEAAKASIIGSQAYRFGKVFRQHKIIGDRRRWIGEAPRPTRQMWANPMSGGFRVFRVLEIAAVSPLSALPMSS